ncbi:polysaccharide deacetylase family protein [Luteolibacter marinus]|uniref:polysaccharide deacetylase family protein n=1 Tax=Luteolibacter marinus TaxID=2776705 RepID=UPI001868111A|nr:polysaccharide deacetylase family protein [Luteolibacter marinus]
MALQLALKIDVDTDRGTSEGVPALVSLLAGCGIPATFLFSLGPDNTGKAIRRVFRPGFFKKVSRTGVVQMYGVRTLLNGTLLPAPHIGRRHHDLMREVHDKGFEAGIHCHDHYHWQDHLFDMSLEEVRDEFGRARAEFERIFGFAARTAGAAGWQASAASKQVYDEAGLRYASDCRGGTPFFPRIDGKVFRTLEIPTTLPTLDELLGRPEFPDDAMVPHYLGLLRDDRPNVFTLHAEIEGMSKLPLFRCLLREWLARGVTFVTMETLADQILARREEVPVRDMEMAEIDGRSGTVATHAA